MARKALILVEGHRGNGPLYIQAAQRLGLEPITLSVDPAQYQYLRAENIEAIRVDTGNLHELIDECSRLRETYDIAGITGFSGDDESVSATVGKLCRKFDLPGPNFTSIERCCDKSVQRQMLSEAGVPMPTYRVAASVMDVTASAAEIGLPVIIKPAVGSGSSGVRLCRNFDEVTEHTTYLLGGKHIWRASPKIMVEEFAQGPHYISHMMGDELVGIEAANFGPPPHFVFRDSIFPAPLTDEEHERMARVSLSCLRALGLGWGPTNIEIRWIERGPVVIEVNPRLSGGLESIQLAYGIDLITAHTKLVIGGEWDLRRRRSHTAAWWGLLPDCDGILNWIHGEGPAAAIPGVAEVKLFVEPKKRIIRKGDYRDSMGHIIVASPNAALTKAILQRAVDLIDWSITPFPPE